MAESFAAGRARASMSTPSNSVSTRNLPAPTDSVATAR